MDAIEFAKLVQQMRAAQKRYFAQRDSLENTKRVLRGLPVLKHCG